MSRPGHLLRLAYGTYHRASQAPRALRASSQASQESLQGAIAPGAALWLLNLCNSIEGGPFDRRATPVAEIDFRPFLALRRHLRIAHHIPGRIRLRAGPAILKELGSVDGKSLERALHALRGIGAVRANPRAGSVVVEYLPSSINPDWWETLISGPEDAAEALLQRLLENELAPAVTAVRAESLEPHDSSRPIREG